MAEKSWTIVTGAAGFIGCNVVAELNRRGEERILVVDELGNDDRWKNFDAGRPAHARAALERIRDHAGLSRDVREIVGRSLG